MYNISISAIISLGLIGFFNPVATYAQSILWVEEPAVKSHLSQYQDKLKKTTKVNGWRVQFYSTTDRRNMETTIRQLKNKYPGLKFSWVYVEPYYQIRAGAFLYRKDTASLQHLLKKDYAGAFPIQDEIDVLDLLENN